MSGRRRAGSGSGNWGDRIFASSPVMGCEEEEEEEEDDDDEEDDALIDEEAEMLIVDPTHAPGVVVD